MKTEKEIRKELKKQRDHLGSGIWYGGWGVGYIAALQWVLENEKAKAKVKK